jgi:serine protein kinase
MADKETIIRMVERSVDPAEFRKQHWQGTFEQYLQMVTEEPAVARNAFQRIYDMILHFGTERYSRLKQDYIRYKFFDDPIDGGADAIYGLDRWLMQLVDFFKSAAQGYGTERRILLLHGPVGSSKSTIVRLLKKGLQYYSRLPEGALHTFSWRVAGADGQEQLYPCPMHEDPLKLVPREARRGVLGAINAELPEDR